MVKTEQVLGSEPIIGNPFDMDKMQRISISYSKVFSAWYAHIEFKDGSTVGKQEFRVDGPNAFPEMVLKIKQFLEHIEKIS